MVELTYKMQLLTLGQEFSGYHAQLKKCIVRIEAALKEIHIWLKEGLRLAQD